MIISKVNKSCCLYLAKSGFVILIKFVVHNYWLHLSFFSSFVVAFLLIHASCSVTSLNSNPLALSTAMHFQKADWNYVWEEASCASLLSQCCEGVSLPGVSLALFRALSFPLVYGPLSIISNHVEMLFESLLGTRCSSATVRGFP